MELFNIYIRVKDRRAQVKHALEKSQIEELISAIKDQKEFILLDGKIIYLWDYEVINIFDVSKSLNPSDKAALKNEIQLLKGNLKGVPLLSSFGKDVTHEFKIPNPCTAPAKDSGIIDYDLILNKALRDGFISFSKDSLTSELRAKQQLNAFNLIVEKGNSFVLTKEGYNAIEVGGYQKWRDLEESKNVMPNIALSNVSIINGNSNKINQKLVENTTVSSEASKYSWLEIISWIIGIVVGIIAIYQFFFK